MRTHPAYPLTDTNTKLYQKLHRLARRRRRTADVVERLALRYEIGQVTQEIRKVGMQR